MNDHTPDRAALRDQIAAAIWERCNVEGVSPRLVVDDPRNIADAVLAVLPPVSRADVLTAAERTMLTYALNQAQERIWAEDGFTDEDQAAVDSLRRMADEEQPATETQAAALKRAHVALAEQAGRDQAALARVREVATRWQAVAAEKDDAVILVGVASDMILGVLDSGEQPATETRVGHWRPVPLATPCIRCSHPFNWHDRRGCQFGNEVNRCGCTVFTPGEKPAPVDPYTILGIDAPAVVAEQPAAADTDE